MSKYKPSIVEKTLNEMFSPEWLRQTAKETKMIKRERKVDAVVMFWVMVLSFGVRLQRTLASLKREYEKEDKTHLSDGSWYERFTPELVLFLKTCVSHGIEMMSKQSNRKLNDKLKKFNDVFIVDSTIVRLHKSFAKVWPAARTRKVAAGVKVGMLISAVSDGPKRVIIRGERTNELKTLRIGPWIKNCVLLIDLGFYKHQVFTRIKEYGGHFVSRVKGNADPYIVAVHQTYRGNSIDVVGKYLSEILPRLKRSVLDVEVEVSFRRREYNGKHRGDTERFRLVAVYNEEYQKYHTYLTTIPLDVLSAEDVALLYGLRWDVELIFKELKSKYALDVVDTTNPQIVEAFIWTAILTLLVSRRIYALVRENNPGKKLVRYTQLRWSTIFAENASDQLTTILEYCGITRTFETVMTVYDSHALDPHVNRYRFREEWRA